MVRINRASRIAIHFLSGTVMKLSGEKSWEADAAGIGWRDTNGDWGFYPWSVIQLVVTD